MEEKEISNEKLLSDDKFDKIISLVGISGGLWAIDMGFAIQEFAKLMNNYELGIPISRERISLTAFAGSKTIDFNIEDSFNNYESIPKGSIAKLTLSGAMRLDGNLCSYGTLDLEKVMNKLSTSDNISGLILEIASGGGEVAAGNQMYTAIKSFSKPVVAAVRFAGSAAYMAACACDEIIGLGSLSEFGSIGAYYSANKSVIQYIKNNYIDIYSRKSSQKNKEWNDLVQGSTEAIKDKLDTIVSEFHKIVISNRKEVTNNKELLKDTLEGGMFLASDAKKRGLVDQIGNMQTVLSRINSHIKLNK